MRVYLVRHGIAVDLGEKGVKRDEDRMLSEEGRKKTAEAAAGFARLHDAPDLLASSPLVRAVETAEAFRSALGMQQPVAIISGLRPFDDPGDAIAWMNGQERDTVMLVGHMPHMEALASALLTDDHSLALEFKKVAVCTIDFPGMARAGAGVLAEFLGPRPLRQLSRA